MKNINLKTKLTMGFFVVILIMFSAAMFGLWGLIDNTSQFNTVIKISEEGQLSDEIDSYLYSERLAFKKYETSNNQDYINQYKEIGVKMQKSVSRFLEISKDKKRIEFIQQIMEKSNDYKNHFDDYVSLSNSLSTYYKEQNIYGEELLNALSVMKKTSYEMEDFQTYYVIANTLEHFLNARLSSSKYFYSHDQDEFNLYSSNYKLFEEDANLLTGIEKKASYMLEYNTLVKSMPMYKKSMDNIYTNIGKMDKDVAYMDLNGPEVSNLTGKIKTSSADETNRFNSSLQAANEGREVSMVIIFLISITVAILVVYNILKIILKPINFLTSTFESIAASDANVDFRLPENSNDEIGKMSKSFNIFMVKIKEMIEEVKYQNWLKTAETEISEIVRVENDIDIITNQTVDYLCKYLNMLIGALYLPNEEGNFCLNSSYSYTNRKCDRAVIKTGEGVIGQVIKDKKLIILRDLPEDYILVQSGLGNSKPNSIIVLPCQNEDELICIIELANFEGFNEHQVKLLEALSEVIGRLLHSVKVRLQMEELLDKTLIQAEELQMQQEELRQSNEELEEQAKALRESESKLQNQQEELRVSNEELETHAKQLEEQKSILNEKNDALMVVQGEMIKKADDLEKANKYKSEFFANMSHELRTPLNSILVLSQLLETRDPGAPLTDKEKQFAKTIHSSGEDLLTLINDILDLSKVEAGKLVAHNEKVYLKDVLIENERLFEPMAGMKKLELKLTIEPNMPEYIVTDSMRLNQIIKNLISNAIKFTHKGYVKANFRGLNNNEVTPLNLKPEDYIGLEVADSGIGIPEDKQQEVFEAFKQSDGTTSRQYGGTGLGLTISLELAKLLGGNILLESELNKGSKFLLVLPREPMAKGVEMDIINDFDSIQEIIVETVTDKSEAGGINSVSKQDKSILIIEDDKAFAKILCDLAEDKGYISYVAYNGKDGILQAKSQRPTGIILDMGLPDMDGLILAKILSADETTKDIPIHIISGSEERVNEAMPKSIIGFLKKPVDIKSVYKTLSKIESFDSRGEKKILVVGACDDEDFEMFSKLGNVSLKKVLTGKEAIEELTNQQYGCIVLDIKLTDINSVDFMTKLRSDYDIDTPIIIYTKEEVSPDEIYDINKYAETIILKSSKSKDRLVDEVSLFLHDVNKNISDSIPTSKIIADDKNSLVGVNVLLADDDSRNVFALMHVLEQNGMNVIVAKDGLEAVNKFGENKIDVVLMDIMMPNMDGYEATKKIRETLKGKNTPIIALTAKAMIDDRDKCISAGTNDYLTKPVDIKKLISMIRVWSV